MKDTKVVISFYSCCLLLKVKTRPRIHYISSNYCLFLYVIMTLTQKWWHSTLNYIVFVQDKHITYNRKDCAEMADAVIDTRLSKLKVFINNCYGGVFMLVFLQFSWGGKVITLYFYGVKFLKNLWLLCLKSTNVF